MTISIRGTISGRVQGVGFRNCVRHHAQQLGVMGYARNLADGSVEVLLQGPSPAVSSVQVRVEQGPPGSRVDRVEWAQAASADLAKSFLIG